MSAAWIDANHEGCGERLLGVLDDTTLTIGPVHNAPTDSNPYFISLISPETKSFTVSMQSSISSKALNTTWWDVDADAGEDSTEYAISGKLANDKDLQDNSFKGEFGKNDLSWCGVTRNEFDWKHRVDTSKFKGTVTPSNAEFTVEGSMKDKETGRIISYAIQFHGKWDARSAKLELNNPIPTWPKPGSNDRTSTEGSATPSGILIDTNAAPTTNSGRSQDDDDDDDIGSTRKIGLGAIAAITAGLVFLIGLIGMAIFCVRTRRKRKENERVYPEVAYIYTPSPDPSLDSEVGYSKILANYTSTYRGSDLQMREVLVNDHSLPVTNQHQWRQF